MKKIILIISITCYCAIFAQSKMYIYQSDNTAVGVPLSAALKGANNVLYISYGGTSSQIKYASIDSIAFGQSSDTVIVKYNGTSASIVNPLTFEGVSIAASGGNVVITSTSTTKNLICKISGTATNGSLKVYSSIAFYVIMNNLTLTNQSGPAINFQSGSTANVVLLKGTANSITDGASYADTYTTSSGSSEDQNAAFFSKGTVSFTGTGSLTINGKGSSKHGLYSKDYVNVKDAALTIASATKDGIHPKDGFSVESGTVKITASSDAVDADAGYVSITGGSVTANVTSASADGIKSYTTMNIANAEINVTLSGDKGKALSSGQNMTLGTGNFTINTSGNAVLESSGSGYDPSYCTAIKSDSSVTINGSNIVIKATGVGGKGISADKNIAINSGTVNITTSGGGATYKNSTGTLDSYHSTCISSDVSISILGGTVTTSSSGAAGRGITSDGTLIIGSSNSSPTINLTTTGSSIYLSGSGDAAEYDEAKAIKCDGAITINNGNITISSANDGIKSEVSVTINGGIINITKAYEGIEAPYIYFNNGTTTIAASDDAVNATKGNGGETNDGSCLYINGGTILVSATTGDGLDSNGSIAMTGGTVVVDGPSSMPEVALDFNGTFNLNGGFFIASGPNSGNMIQAPNTTSSQYVVKVTVSSLVSASTLFNIQDASGYSLVTFKPMRSAYYFIFSSSDLKSGSSYNIYTGGSSTGTYTNGLYVGGAYSGGTLKKNFSVSSKVTTVSF
jgi:trimeric autotransporter adhesin